MNKGGGRIAMGIIRKRIFMVEAVVCIWVLIIVFFLQKVSFNNINTIILLIFEFMAILLIFLLHKQCKIYEHAKLIIENTIVSIPLVTFKDKCDENIEIFISCFGILVDSKVIKYNVENINLISFEIKGDYICISYGCSDNIKQTCILHGNLSNEEKTLIKNKLQYETGITPVFK